MTRGHAGVFAGEEEAVLHPNRVYRILHPPPARRATRRWSEGLAFALGSAVVSQACLLSGLVFAGRLQYAALEQSQRARIAERVRTLSGVTEDAFHRHDEAFLLNFLRALKRDTAASYVAVLDSRGRIRLHSAMLAGQDPIGLPWKGPKLGGSGPGRGRPEPRSLTWLHKGKTVEDWSLPVIRLGRRLGEVHLGWDADALRASLLDDLVDGWRRLAALYLCLAPLALAAVWALSRLSIGDAARTAGAAS